MKEKQKAVARIETKTRHLYGAAFTLLLMAAMGYTAWGQEKDTSGGGGKREPGAGWKLIWADEFEQAGTPDPKNWKLETGFLRNEEFQWYQTENARCEKGLLIIEGRRERKPNPNFEAGNGDWKKKREFADYTAASMSTDGLHSWQYGRFEMRAKIETGNGLWPAFWTVGVDGEWPSNGEIDIMEFYRGKLLANVAWGTDKRWNAKWNSTARPLSELGDKDWATKFHIWRMDWDEESIKLYVDDKLLNDTSLKDTINGDGSGKNPFKQPHFIILNLAIGGQNGGDPAGTAFPSRFEVDYVRVYQRDSKPKADVNANKP